LDAEPLVDDFTGEAIARVWPDAKPKTVPSAQELDQRRHQAESEARMALLEAVGILAKPAQVPACARPNSEPAGPRRDRKLKARLVIEKPWRRI
jgi:hypothetical protein